MAPEPIDLGIEDLADAVEVGAGGFGTVYKARQESLRRDVAVKMVTSTVKDRKVRIRFEREIQAMGMLFMLSTAALALALGHSAHIDPELGLASALGLIPAILGMILGRKIRGYLSETRFRQVFFAGVLLLGLSITAHAALS